MGDKVVLLLLLLVAVAGTVFGVVVLDKSLPVALLIAATPPASLGAALLLKNRSPN